MAYHLEGRLLEVCNCRVLCPCWIGEDPDYGTCDTIIAWHFDKGTVNGVDVSDRTIAMIAHVPGQHPARQLEGGRLPRRARVAGAGGGAARRVHRQARRSGRRSSRSSSAKWCRSRRCRSRSTCRAATARSSSAMPATPSSSRTRARAARPRRSQDTVFSTVPGAPVFVGKSPQYRAKVPKLGIDLDLKGHNALQSTFVFDAA